MSQYPVELVAGTYHDRLLVPFTEYREFINEMTGSYVFLHDVARARREIAEHISRQNRLIKTSPTPPEKTDSGSGGRYIKAVKRHFGGDTIALRPMPKGKFVVRTVAEAHQ